MLNTTANTARRTLLSRGLISSAIRSSSSSSSPASVGIPQQQQRQFSLHEYQSHELFAKHGITIPKNKAVSTPEEAEAAAKEIGGFDFVVKAQILAGGRGKGVFTNGFKGGVHKAFSTNEVKEFATKMLGKTLVTKQTGPSGKPVNVVFVQERVYARRELYFSIMLDRQTGGPLLIGSASGGMSIEDIAAENPGATVKHPVDINTGLSMKDAEGFAKKLGFSGSYVSKAAEEMCKLYKLFCESDATLVEINPMIEVPRGGIVCADAKVTIDESAEFRQKELFGQRDWSQEDYRDIEAARYDLNYIGLDGNIGCIVNGAGLAMSTMDIIKMNGGEPANFLDVGGGATEKQITEALKILNSDRQVKAILVNIFGGIMRCDVIAMGLINAANQVALRCPLVVRLQGTNVSEAKKLIEDSGVKMISATDLDDAAGKAVRVARIVEAAGAMNVKVNFEIPI